jgi:hypothetical protein
MMDAWAEIGYVPTAKEASVRVPWAFKDYQKIQDDGQLEDVRRWCLSLRADTRQAYIKDLKSHCVFPPDFMAVA